MVQCGGKTWTLETTAQLISKVREYPQKEIINRIWIIGGDVIRRETF